MEHGQRMSCLLLVAAVVASGCVARQAPREQASPTSPSPSPSPEETVELTSTEPQSADCGTKESRGGGVPLEIRYKCYSVNGTTASDLLSDMDRRGPGVNFGVVRWEVRWSFGGSGISTCSTDRVAVRVKAQATYPRWASPDERPADLVSAWGRFFRRLERLLERFLRTAEDAGAATHDVLEDFQAPCGSYIADAKEAARDAIDRYQQKTAQIEARGPDLAAVLEGD